MDHDIGWISALRRWGAYLCGPAVRDGRESESGVQGWRRSMRGRRWDTRCGLLESLCSDSVTDDSTWVTFILFCRVFRSSLRWASHTIVTARMRRRPRVDVDVRERSRKVKNRRSYLATTARVVSLPWLSTPSLLSYRRVAAIVCQVYNSGHCVDQR
jgi:hypothetical protein